MKAQYNRKLLANALCVYVSSGHTLSTWYTEFQWYWMNHTILDRLAGESSMHFDELKFKRTESQQQQQKSTLVDNVQS